MAVSDAVVSNLTGLYVAVIACIKAYGFLCGRSFSGGFVLIASTAVVALILVATLTWDVSRKATYAFAADQPPPPLQQHTHEVCKGGICWHGVAVRSPASQVRFRLPQNLPYTTLFGICCIIDVGVGDTDVNGVRKVAVVCFAEMEERRNYRLEKKRESW
ncbi:hypothetical protein E2542_SST14672 [Spatholobus suberectus]|nr:hypothetical protein E2542_SST14672 [Spatholobus suberectus]